MKIDKTIELPEGTIVFRGELTEEEVEHLITLGLVYSYLRGDINSTVMLDNGLILSEEPDQLQ